MAGADYNIETWTNIRKKDLEKMESIQGNVLRKILNLPKTTSYLGILYELDILPIRLQLIYKKLMLYHHSVFHSDITRTIRKTFLAQEENNLSDSWFGKLREEARTVGIEVSAVGSEESEERGMCGRCPLCGNEDSTEHVFNCKEVDNNTVIIGNLEESIWQR